MDSKHPQSNEKDLLHQITYLTRLIEQKKNAPSRKNMVNYGYFAAHSASNTVNNLQNKYKLTRLNDGKSQSKPSPSVLQSCDNVNLTYARLKVLNKRINTLKKLTVDKSKDVQAKTTKNDEPSEKIGSCADITGKKSIYVNRKKLVENLKFKEANCNKNCVHVNPAKLQLKCTKSETKSCKTDDSSNKVQLKNVIHINPKFNKSSLSLVKRTVSEKNGQPIPESSQCIISNDGNIERNKNCRSDVVTIHFNKKFIDKNSKASAINESSKSHEIHSSIKIEPDISSKNIKITHSLPKDSMVKPDVNCTQVSDECVKLKSKTSCEINPDAVSHVTKPTSLPAIKRSCNSIVKSASKNNPLPSENLLKAMKLRKALLKNQINRSLACKQVQNVLIKNPLVQKHLSMSAVHRYKNRNKIINIRRTSNVTSRKIINQQLTNKLLCSTKKLSNSSSKNMKLSNKTVQTPLKLQPALKRSNSNSKLLKLVKLSKTKLVRAKSDLSSSVNKSNARTLNVLRKINQNSINIKRNKRVWLASDKNTQSSIDNKHNTPSSSCKRLQSRFKYNSKLNSDSNKSKYVKVNSSLKSSSARIVNPMKYQSNRNLNTSKGNSVKKPGASVRKLSQNSDLVSVSRTKLVRRSNIQTKSTSGASKNLLKLNNLSKNKTVMFNNKVLKTPTQTKRLLTLRTARLVKTKYKLIRNLNLSRSKINRNAVATRNHKGNFNINFKTKISRGIMTSSLRQRRKSVTIGGIKYHTTKLKLRRKFPVKDGKTYNNKIFRNKGESYRVAKGGRSLKRIIRSDSRRRQINRFGRNQLQYRYNASQRTAAADFAYNKVIQAKQRSIALLTRKFRKSNEPCLIFNRLGRCTGQERGVCNRLHDRKRVAICKKFLQGACEKKECLLSHDVVPSKMPTCRHYLAGVCMRNDCPYLHVKVNSCAPICVQFLQGYCPNAEECKNRHISMCPEYEGKGVCSKGKSCPYPHPKFKDFPKQSDVAVFSHRIVSSDKKDKEIKPEEVSETDSKLSRYYCAHEYDSQSQTTSLKRNNYGDSDENLVGNDWLRKRPRIGDLPGFIPLDSDSNLSQ